MKIFYASFASSLSRLSLLQVHDQGGRRSVPRFLSRIFQQSLGTRYPADDLKYPTIGYTILSHREFRGSPSLHDVLASSLRVTMAMVSPTMYFQTSFFFFNSYRCDRGRKSLQVQNHRASRSDDRGSTIPTSVDDDFGQIARIFPVTCQTREVGYSLTLIQGLGLVHVERCLLTRKNDRGYAPCRLETQQRSKSWTFDSSFWTRERERGRSESFSKLCRKVSHPVKSSDSLRGQRSRRVHAGLIRELSTSLKSSAGFHCFIPDFVMENTGTTSFMSTGSQSKPPTLISEEYPQ
ncbi:hypothetical protein OSB04_016651 [Centaurea solstitialis]|uniref:Uncharacterized protein n=1 Tax=Centaurea solstitialis TaxID=347529 RepID=A0AA38WLA2_9ASTR|nr:hypothetical protein OSB04_016651 [Centaurea solstitialis]